MTCNVVALSKHPRYQLARRRAIAAVEPLGRGRFRCNRCGSLWTRVVVALRDPLRAVRVPECPECRQ